MSKALENLPSDDFIPLISLRLRQQLCYNPVINGFSQHLLLKNVKEGTV